MVSKGFPNVITSGRQYNIGEKPSVILYTYINLHAGTPKPKSCCSECESVSAVTDSTKYGSVEGSFVSKNPTVELEQLTTVV